MSEINVKDFIEPIPDWKYTNVISGTRDCGKSYIQSLLDEQNKEIENLQSQLQEKEKIIEDAIKCIKELAVEDEDYSKIYNEEEKELLSILERRNIIC